MTLDDSAALTVDRRDFSMHWLTLQFREAELEDNFAADNYARQISITRLSVVMGAFVFSLFGILDSYIVPEVLYEAWLLRFGLVCPVLLGLVAFSYSGHISYKNSGWLSLAMVAPGITVVTLTAIADAPGAYLYYAGLIVVIAYSNCLWRLSYIYSTAVSLTTVAAYQWVIVFVNPVPFEIFISNNAFMGSAVGISMFLNYVQERQLRVSFVDNEKLRFEQRRSERLLSRSEAASRAKNDFLAIMSHELRTPLNAIIGFSEIIANQMFGPVGQARYVDYAGDIRSSGAHLLSIINDILDISKAEAGKLQLEEEPLDPVESLNRTMRMFRQRASELSVDLTFRVRDDIPWMIVDPRLFNQVAINLTSNALKFTPEGGQVRVDLGLDSAGDLVLSVEDTGIGVKASDITRIFEPFVQVEDAMSRTQQGTGLGLPLVRKIMSLHGGTVELESRVGEGTTVKATFPKSRFVAPDVENVSRQAH
ncbi:MAG: ATP-binding protein [Parvibaculum sp.]|uniref:sensor histidine kinase n=1 Tax=Parvibaculum sp. TaxID=2024848 RepID=UPI0027206C03|nr:ATP-binding protein [Parvibaculum sp.]MDO8838326.1 ATP-binding protein [Parvibaculum sp.]